MRFTHGFLLPLVAMVPFTMITSVRADFCDDIHDHRSADTFGHKRTTHSELPDGTGKNLLSSVNYAPSKDSGLKKMKTGEHSAMAGVVPSQCDWQSGTEENGEGKKQCVAFCRDHFRDQGACDGSRCLAWNGGLYIGGPKAGKAKPGQCYCTCGCPTSDEDSK
ncbi:hypothetical protein SLS57_008237 [Botryosphaeria dothidea]